MKKLFGLVGLLSTLVGPAIAGTCSSYPYTLNNGQTADANQVMADFNLVRNCFVNSGASNGANSDITSLNGLLTPLSIAQGGTGGTTGTGGPAGGRLSGSYPNPALSASGVAAGSYTFPSLSISADGTVSAASNGSNFTGDSGSGGTQGLVPAPPAGTASAGAFLSAGGSWLAPSVFPSQSGNAYKALTTNGSAPTWSGFTVAAYAAVSCTSGGCTLGSSAGVSSVTRSAAGTYTVNLSPALSVSPVATATSSQYSTTIPSESSTSISVNTYSSPGTLVDSGFNVVVIGH